MSKLTTNEVQNIAKLARLELGEQEVEKFSGQLSSILDYVEQLQEVNTDNVEPTAQVTGLKNITRDDVEDQCDIQDELIKCAPDGEDRFVRVKNVL